MYRGPRFSVSFVIHEGWSRALSARWSRALSARSLLRRSPQLKSEWQTSSLCGERRDQSLHVLVESRSWRLVFRQRRRVQQTCRRKQFCAERHTPPRTGVKLAVCESSPLRIYLRASLTCRTSTAICICKNWWLLSRIPVKWGLHTKTYRCSVVPVRCL